MKKIIEKFENIIKEINFLYELIKNYEENYDAEKYLANILKWTSRRNNKKL